MASGIPVEIRYFAAVVVGQSLPDVNTDELTTAARMVMAQVAEMSGPWRAEFDDVLGSVAGYAGPGAGQMQNAMATLDKYHNDMSDNLTRLADYLDQSAAQVKYAQTSMAVQTAQLIVQLSIQMALAPYTGGASMKDVPDEIAATRVILGEMFAELVEELAKQAVIGAGNGALADALAQWILSAQGILQGVDGGQVLTAAAGGALGGVFGGIGGHLGVLGHDALGGALKKDLGDAADGALGEGVAKDTAAAGGPGPRPGIGAGADDTPTAVAPEGEDHGVHDDPEYTAELISQAPPPPADGPGDPAGDVGPAREAPDDKGADTGLGAGIGSGAVGNGVTGGTDDSPRPAVVLAKQPFTKVASSNLTMGLGNEAGSAADAQATGQPVQFNGWGVASAVTVGAATHALHTALHPGPAPDTHDPAVPDPTAPDPAVFSDTGSGNSTGGQSPGGVRPGETPGPANGHASVARPPDDPGTGQAHPSGPGDTSDRPSTLDISARPDQVKQTIDPGRTTDRAGRPSETVDQTPPPGQQDQISATASAPTSAPAPASAESHRQGAEDAPVPERPAVPSGPDGRGPGGSGPDGPGPDHPPEGGPPVSAPVDGTRLPQNPPDPVSAWRAHMEREKASGENALKARLDALAPKHPEVTVRQLTERFGALRPESSVPMLSEHLDHEVRSAWERFDADAEVVRRQLGGTLPPEVAAIQWDMTEHLTVAHRVTFDRTVPVHRWNERVMEKHLLTWAGRRDEVFRAADAKLKALTDASNGRVPRGEVAESGALSKAGAPDMGPDRVRFELDALKVPDQEPVGFADLEERYLELRRAEFAEAGMDAKEFMLSQRRIGLFARDGNPGEAIRLLDERQKNLTELSADRLRAALAEEDELAARLKKLKQDAPAAPEGELAERYARHVQDVEDALNALPDVPRTVPDAGSAARTETGGEVTSGAGTPESSSPAGSVKSLEERLARLRRDDPEPDGIGRQARDAGVRIKELLEREKEIDKAYAEGRNADALRLTTSYLDRIRQAKEDQRALNTSLRMREFREQQARDAGMTRGQTSALEHKRYLDGFGKKDGGGPKAVEKGREVWEEGLADARARRDADIETSLDQRMKRLRVPADRPSNDPRTPEQIEATRQALEEKLNGLDAVPTAVPAVPESGSTSSASGHDPRPPSVDDLPPAPEGEVGPAVDPELLKRFEKILGREPLDEGTLLGDAATAPGNDAKPEMPTSPTPDTPATVEAPTTPDAAPDAGTVPAPETAGKPDQAEPPGRWTVDVQTRSLRRPDKDVGQDVGQDSGEAPGKGSGGKPVQGSSGQEFQLEFVKGEGEGFPRAVLRAVQDHPRRDEHAGLTQLSGMAGPQELRDVLADKALAILRSAPDLRDLRELLRSKGLDPQAEVDQLRRSGDFWTLTDDLAPRLLSEVFQLRVVLVDLDGGQEVYPPLQPGSGSSSDALPEFVFVRDRTRGTDHYWSASTGGDRTTAVTMVMKQPEESAPDPEAEEFAQDLAVVGRLGPGTPEQLVGFGKLWRLYHGPHIGSDGAYVARWSGLYFAVDDALRGAGVSRTLHVGIELGPGSPAVRRGRRFRGFASVVDRITSSAAGRPKRTARALLDWLDHRLPLGRLPRAAQEFALLTHLTAVAGGERGILDGFRDALEGIAEAANADAPRLWRAFRDAWSAAVDGSAEVTPSLDPPVSGSGGPAAGVTGGTGNAVGGTTVSAVQGGPRGVGGLLSAGAGVEVFSGVPGFDAGAVRGFASTIGTPGTGQDQDGGGWDGLLKVALAEVGQVVRLPPVVPPVGEGGMAGLLETLPAPLYWMVTVVAHHLHDHGYSSRARHQARELAERMRQAAKLRPTGLDGGAPPTGRPATAIPATDSASPLDQVRNTALTAAAEHLAGLDDVQQAAVRQQAEEVIARYRPANTTLSFDEGEMDVDELHDWYRIQYSFAVDPAGAVADTLARDYARHLTGRSAPPTRTSTAVDLAVIPLPELDALRARMPVPSGQQADEGQRADYAMALALTSTPMKPLDHKVHGVNFAPKNLQQYQNHMSVGLLMSSGAHLHSSLANATVQNMKQAYGLARQTDKKGKLLSATAVSREVTNAKSNKFLVEGFWFAVGLRESGVPDPMGARAVVRRAVDTLARAVEDAEPGVNVQQEAVRIARRIYRPGGQATESQVAVVEELLRQRDENPQTFAPALVDPASTSFGNADPVLDSVELPELDALRARMPVPPVKHADEGQRADYAMALALTSTSTEPLDHTVHGTALAPNAGVHQKYKVNGLLMGSGAHFVNSIVHSTVPNMKQAYDLARQTDRNGRPFMASGISKKLLGHGNNWLMFEGFWFAVGLRESGVPDSMGARAVVRRAVGTLAKAVEDAEPGLDVRQKAVRVARRIYRPGGQATESQVAVVEELLRQRDENPQTFAPSMAAPADTSSSNPDPVLDTVELSEVDTRHIRTPSPVGNAESSPEELDVSEMDVAEDDPVLDPVELSELDALRAQTPAPPGRNADDGQRADYAMALALTSTPFESLEYTNHSMDLAPNAGRFQNQVAHGLLVGSGAHLRASLANATVPNMKQAYGLAQQTDKNGKLVSATAVSREITKVTTNKGLVDGFWLAVGLRESGALDPRGARAVVRRALDALAGALEDAEPDLDVRQKAVRVARRIYRPGEQPTESQITVVEELLRQRDENRQTFAPSTAGFADTSFTNGDPVLDPVELSELDALRTRGSGKVLW